MMQLFYTVRPGDTISQIARRWGLPLESVIAANNLEPPYTIYIGQQLSVPPGVDVVRVRPGDSVFQIAQSFGVPMSVLIEANQLVPPYTIQTGQLLKVPPGVPYYVVKFGDTLFRIASRFNVVTRGASDSGLIRKVNQLSSDVIFPGDRLTIPYAPPGDQGLIAYTSSRGESYDIWIYDPAKGTSRRITRELGESFSVPFWSPDSRKIAFVGRGGILYVIDLARGTIAQIDQFAEGLGVYLSWSPDSSKLTYTKNDTIIIYQTVTHQAERIIQPGATDVQWFPGGEALLFQAPDQAGVSQLFYIRSDGTGKQQIKQNTGGRLNNVRLSPDGAYVLYTTPGVSISLIYIIELSSGNVFEVSGGPLAKNYFPVWSPDSSTIAYSATAHEDVGYFSLIRTTERKGQNDRTNAISDCFASPVTWSPDSLKIAYLSGCDFQATASEMWLIDMLHPVPIQLIKGDAITALQWSPRPIAISENTYMNAEYQVQFQYPAHWQRVTDERYEGLDGFFQISAISSEDAIHIVCQHEAFQQLLPYGSEPHVSSIKIQGQEACLIFPSPDQPPELNNQAALIVRYPEPVQIKGETYNYFILWADQEHIREISLTLVFL